MAFKMQFADASKGFGSYMAAFLVASGLFLNTPISSGNIPAIVNLCASSSASEALSCCKANEKRLPLPLATGRCETSISCSVIKGMGQAGGPNCRLVYGPELYELLNPEQN